MRRCSSRGCLCEKEKAQSAIAASMEHVVRENSSSHASLVRAAIVEDHTLKFPAQLVDHAVLREGFIRKRIVGKHQLRLIFPHQEANFDQANVPRDVEQVPVIRIREQRVDEDIFVVVAKSVNPRVQREVRVKEVDMVQRKRRGLQPDRDYQKQRAASKSQRLR